MNKKISVKIISIFLIFLIISTIVFAENLQDLNNQKTEINNKINGVNTQLENVKEDLSEVMYEIQELTDKISKYENDIDELDSQLSELKEKIDKVSEELKISEKKYEEQKTALEDRLIAQYETGETTFLDLLLNSNGIVDFISNYYLVAEIAQMDEELLNDIEKEKTRIEIAKQELEQNEAKLKTVKEEKEKSAIALHNAKVVKNNYMNQLTEEERNLQSQIDEYKKQINDIESEIYRLTVSSGGTSYTGGIMAWPVPGYSRITSQFGMRTHPITGVYKLHTGVDVAAPAGANFVAASDGVVTKAGYNSAYGNMVIINHGGGISTLYAHGLHGSIAVSVGQTVKRGQVVLKVGSTGYSTGPHAHFEVRKNGNYVNPLEYITSN